MASCKGSERPQSEQGAMRGGPEGVGPCPAMEPERAVNQARATQYRSGSSDFEAMRCTMTRRAVHPRIRSDRKGLVGPSDHGLRVISVTPWGVGGQELRSLYPAQKVVQGSHVVRHSCA